MKKINTLSLFSGVGGLEIGLDEKVFKTIGFSEIHQSACKILKHNYRDIKNYGSVVNLKGSDIPERVDMVVGGSPCQDLSQAGKNLGLGGKKSSLFFEYVRIIKETNPEYFLWENVKGTFTSSQGKDFLIVRRLLSEAGYHIQWQLLNSSDFGIPHNRNRVFIVGAKHKEDLPYVIDVKDRKKVIFPKKMFNKFCGSLINETGISSTITRSYGAASGDSTKIVVGEVPSRELFEKILEARENRYIRMFDPIESERLMSWPDNHTKYGLNDKNEIEEISIGERRKACGNGIVSKCVEEIFKTFRMNNKFTDETVLTNLSGILMNDDVDVDAMLNELDLKDCIFYKDRIYIKNQKSLNKLMDSKFFEKIKHVNNPMFGSLVDGVFKRPKKQEYKSKYLDVTINDILVSSPDVNTYLNLKQCEYMLRQMR